MNCKPLLLINHRSPAKNSGKATGIANYMIKLTEHLLDRRGFRIGLVSSWNQNDFPEEITSRLDIFRKRRLIYPRVADTLWQSIYMPRLTAETGADVVLSVDPIGTPAGGKVRLFVVHDLYFKTLASHHRWRERLFSDLILRMMLAGNDAVICVSDSTLNDLQKFYQRSREISKRIYSGAPTQGQGDPCSHGSQFQLLWVSNVTANKNIDCFYAALELLAERGCFIETVVVGADPHGIEARARSRLRHARCPTRLANITPETLAGLYRNSFCLVNTSLSEGFGLPILEAQSNGTAVVCPRGGAVAEIGGKSSVLTFEQNSASDLADKILAVSENHGLRNELICKGLENSQKFSWQKTAAQVESLALSSLEKKLACSQA